MRWLDPSQLYIASLISNGATPYCEFEVNVAVMNPSMMNMII